MASLVGHPYHVSLKVWDGQRVACTVPWMHLSTASGRQRLRGTSSTFTRVSGGGQGILRSKPSSGFTPSCAIGSGGRATERAIHRRCLIGHSSRRRCSRNSLVFYTQQGWATAFGFPGFAYPSRDFRGQPTIFDDYASQERPDTISRSPTFSSSLSSECTTGNLLVRAKHGSSKPRIRSWRLLQVKPG